MPAVRKEPPEVDDSAARLGSIEVRMDMAEVQVGEIRDEMRAGFRSAREADNELQKAIERGFEKIEGHQNVQRQKREFSLANVSAMVGIGAAAITAIYFLIQNESQKAQNASSGQIALVSREAERHAAGASRRDGELLDIARLSARIENDVEGLNQFVDRFTHQERYPQRIAELRATVGSIRDEQEARSATLSSLRDQITSLSTKHSALAEWSAAQDRANREMSAIRDRLLYYESREGLGPPSLPSRMEFGPAPHAK